MIRDKNVRSLAAMMKIMQAIIDAGKSKEFIEGCKDNQESMFIVGTDASRAFVAQFLRENKINPAAGELHGFTYAGNTECT